MIHLYRIPKQSIVGSLDRGHLWGSSDRKEAGRAGNILFLGLGASIRGVQFVKMEEVVHISVFSVCKVQFNYKKKQNTTQDILRIWHGL